MTILRRWGGHTAAVACLLAIQPAIAQQIPDAGSLLRQQELFDQSPRSLQLPVIESVEAEKKTMDDNAATILVRELRISGAPKAFPESSLIRLIEDAEGQTLSLSGLQSLAMRITRHYRDNGYFLSRAYLPRQDVTDGIITIKVLEVGLEPGGAGIRIMGEGLRIRPEVAYGVIRQAVPIDMPMRETDLERGLLLLNGVPGLTARGSLEPGDRQGASRIALGLMETPLVRYGVAVDNAAGRYSGTERVSASIGLHNPTGRGDQFLLSANASDRHNTYGGAFYERPLGHAGLYWHGGLNHLRYRLGKELAALEAEGESTGIFAGLRYPVVLNRLNSLWVRGRVTHKALEDRANGVVTSDKTISALNLGLDWQRFHAGGLTQITLEARYGRLSIDRSTGAFAADQSRTGPGKNGYYTVLAAHTSRLQRINERFNLHASLDGQLASRNLDSAERLQFGGPFGVRAYPTGEGSGDEGVKLTLEGRFTLWRGTPLGDVQASLFYDKAWLSLYHNPGRLDDPSLDNHYRISGWGLSLAAIAVGRSQVSLTWARKIGSNPLANPVSGKDGDGTRDKSRFWINASVSF